MVCDIRQGSDVDPDPDPVRIQVNKITKLISNHHLKVERAKKYFQICTRTLGISYFFRFKLKNIISCEKKTKIRKEEDMKKDLYFHII